MIGILVLVQLGLIAALFDQIMMDGGQPVITTLLAMIVIVFIVLVFFVRQL